jgi:RimJ/RimL family protein N-acetyltransferase
MISLRKLQLSDDVNMYEWLNDPEINSYLNVQNEKKTIEAVREFINISQNDNSNIHYAICDVYDVYLGTISLKNVDYKNRHAEYAIVLRNSQRGKGIAQTATELLIKKAKTELKLHKIYLNVLTDNNRAIKLYERIGFVRKGIYEQHILKENKYFDLFYYELLLEEATNEI